MQRARICATGRQGYPSVKFARYGQTERTGRGFRWPHQSRRRRWNPILPPCCSINTARPDVAPYCRIQENPTSGAQMKKLLLASSALAFAGSAFAADLQPAPRMAVKAPVVAAVPFSWTGCYVGAEAGYGWGTKDFTDPFAVNFADVGQVVRTN